jgi:hypothetical protein
MLSEDQPLELAGLVADLNERNKPDLAELAVALSQEAERVTGGDDERLARLARDSALLISGRHIADEQPAPATGEAEIAEDQLAVLSRRMRERASAPNKLRMPTPN